MINTDLCYTYPRMSEPVNYPPPGSKKNKVALLFLTIIFILLLFIISESIYIIRNQPDKITGIYLNLARISAQKKFLKPTIKFLDKATQLTLNHRVQDRPQINLKNIQKLPRIPNNQNLKQDFINYLSTVNYSALTAPYSADWSIIYYDLGSISHKNLESDLVAPFWQTAVNLAPEWSHFHLLLANYYFSINKTDLAYKQIDYCLTFTYPQKACNRFLRENTQTGKTDSVELWQERINILKSDW